MKKQIFESFVLKGLNKSQTVRILAADTYDIVKEAMEEHNLNPIQSVALGQLLTIGTIMGSMMKGSDEKLTLQIKGEKYIKEIVVTANALGDVKGYIISDDSVTEPEVLFSVGSAIGGGRLTVIKDFGLKEPYNSHMELGQGEIAENITAYFANSEQTPTSVGASVRLDSSGKLIHSTGYIVQLMPEASESDVELIETSVKGFKFNGAETPEQIIKSLMDSFEYKITDRVQYSLRCDCSSEKLWHILKSLGSKEIREMVKENMPIEVKCEFCDKKYEFSVNELNNILNAIIKDKFSFSEAFSV